MHRPRAIHLQGESGEHHDDERDGEDHFEVVQHDRSQGTVALEPTVVHFFHGPAPEA